MVKVGGKRNTHKVCKKTREINFREIGEKGNVLKWKIGGNKKLLVDD